MNDKTKKNRIRDKRLNKLIKNFSISISLLVLLFFVSVFAGLLINSQNLIESEILNRSRTHFTNILLTRRWNAINGGVFVEKTEGVESNPYLKDPDIETIDGKVYTKKNPALMTREISELAEDQNDYKFHITSLNPINPENFADDFEIESLQFFEEGESERYKREDIDGILYFRYMAPLVTEESCLQCHREQGYSVGDIRGGISVAFSIDELEKSLRFNTKLIIWLFIGTSGLMLGIFYLLLFKLNRNLTLSQKKIKNLAERDSLTGLHNRRYLYDWAHREMERTIRYEDPISVIMLDIDFFKKVNDQYGHKSGDITLKKFSEILKNCSRNSDLVARYGGEEFLIILTNTDLNGATVFASNLLEKIRHTEIILPTGEKIQVTASLGISSRNYSEEKQSIKFDNLIDEADTAMYSAKKAGRDRVEIYST